MPNANPIPEVRALIKTILDDYIPDMGENATCLDRVMTEVEEGTLVTIVGDEQLVATIKDNFGDAALLTLSNTPDPDTITFQKASVANIADHENKVRKDARLIALKDMLDEASAAAGGEPVDIMLLPQYMKDLFTQNV